MVKLEDVKKELLNCVGTESYHKNFFGLIYTDGIKELSELCKSYWLIDLVSSYKKILNDNEFLIWKIVVNGNSAIVTSQEYINGKKLVNKKIEFTTFPEGTFEWYTNWGGDNDNKFNVMMLKSEY